MRRGATSVGYTFRMRIATWNINGTRARLDFILHWLRERSPDVVGFQELKLEDDKFPHDALEAAGYEVVTHGQKSWNGVAIASRKPMQVTHRGLTNQDDMGARLIEADVDGLRFITVYVPNGKSTRHEDFPRKLAWLDSLCEHVETYHKPDAPAVLCGDFNIVPGALDSWNDAAFQGEIFHTEEERARFARLQELGFFDTFRERYPEDQSFSWWDYRGGAFHKGQGLRIDFLLATEPVKRRVKEVWIDRDYRKKKEGLIASDHAPVIAELD